MFIPIFWRLILGNAAMLCISVTACIYSIVQLGTLRDSARAALETDQKMIGYQEMLTDTFLSEFRYGGKYIITHSEIRYEPLRQFKNDFSHYMTSLKSLARTDDIRSQLTRIARNYHQYSELFDREVGYIRANQTYSQSRYQQEREKILETVLADLERLKIQLRGGLKEKISNIDSAAGAARRVTIVTAFVVVILGTLISVIVSKKIIASIKTLQDHAGSTSAQNDDFRWMRSLLPEVQSLAQMFKDQQAALKNEAAKTATISKQIADEITPQLFSIQARLQEARENSGNPAPTSEQSTLNRDVEEEIGRLIRTCTQVLRSLPGRTDIPVANAELASASHITKWTPTSLSKGHPNRTSDVIEIVYTRKTQFAHRILAGLDHILAMVTGLPRRKGN